MPQLDPSPWFKLLVFSWSVFLIVATPKVTSHTPPNWKLHHDSNHLATEPWSWSWPPAYLTSS